MHAFHRKINGTISEVPDNLTNGGLIMKALLPRLMPITFVAVVACSGNNIKVGNVVNDAGGPEVSKDATQGAIDCILASNLHYAAPGCGANAVAFCEAPKPERCLALRSVCGCDGKTTIYFDSCDGSSPSPYLYAGACQADAGSPAQDGPEPSWDAPKGSISCTLPSKIRYLTPGCGFDTVPSCEAPKADACAALV